MATVPRSVSSRAGAQRQKGARSRISARRCREPSAPGGARSGAAARPRRSGRAPASAPSRPSEPTSPARTTRSPTGTDRFELEAEFSTAQAVTPGQGQSVDIAGIKVGEVTGVKLEGGHAVVSMEVDNEYAPLIHDDSSLLLRPKTGLNDMVVEVDAGTQSSPEVEEGSTIPLASTQPQVNPDEFLASLDADTQQFLKLLLANGAEALDPEKGRDVKLSNALRRLDPFARDIQRISSALAGRRQNIARSIHNFQLISAELGNRDQDLVDFVDSSDAVLRSFAREQASIRSAVRELPGTLKEARGALTSANEMALQSGPALKKLIPGAKATGPGLRALLPPFEQRSGPIQNQNRPFTQQLASPVTHLAQV